MGDYTPPSFVPGPEPCIMPTLIEQKGRVLAGGTLWRSRDTGVLATVKAEWFYWQESSKKYVVTTNRDNITLDGVTSEPVPPPNPPKIVVTFSNQSGVTRSVEAPQYIKTWKETTPVDPPTVPPTPPVVEVIVEYVSGASKLRQLMNFNEFVTLPTTDGVSGYSSSQDPDIIGYFATVSMTFFEPRIDNEFVLAGAPANPAGIRTGPTYTLANLESTERYNNTGTMEPLNGLSAYNYTTGNWDPYPVN